MLKSSKRHDAFLGGVIETDLSRQTARTHDDVRFAPSAAVLKSGTSGLVCTMKVFANHADGAVERHLGVT